MNEPSVFAQSWLQIFGSCSHSLMSSHVMESPLSLYPGEQEHFGPDGVFKHMPAQGLVSLSHDDSKKK